jgi:heat shock protein HslJ
MGSGRIVDGSWTLTQLGDASGTLSFGGLDAPTLRLLGTGISTAEGTQVSGYGGCNTFTGRYTLDDARVTVGPLASTRRACPGSAAQT